MIKNIAKAAAIVCEALREFERSGCVDANVKSLDWSGLKPAAYVHSVSVIGGPRNVQHREILSLSAVNNRIITPEAKDDSVVFNNTERLYAEKDIVAFLNELGAYLEVSGTLTEVTVGRKECDEVSRINIG